LDASLQNALSLKTCRTAESHPLPKNKIVSTFRPKLPIKKTVARTMNQGFESAASN
jgi:hypothetical protein